MTKKIWSLVFVLLAFTIGLAVYISELFPYARIHMPTSLADATSLQQVPFVPGASDGQTGPQPAPKDRGNSPEIPRALVHGLAYYVSVGLGVLAPRGWHCLGLYGSNGSILIVTPELHGAGDLLQPNSHLAGPAVQLSFSFADTSGRFSVARIAARLFPTKKEFVQRVIDEGIWPRSEFQSGPFPQGMIKRRSDTDVEFETPAGKDGIGTESRLVKGTALISGVAIMTQADDLVLLDIRMPSDLRNLVPIIIQTTRQQSGVFPFPTNGP